MYRRWQTGHGSDLHYLREKEATIYRDIEVRVAHQLPGKPAARAGRKHVGSY